MEASENRTASGVEYMLDGKMVRVEARREVIICAGAFGSPQILELSGIGSTKILSGNGIQIIVSLPGVGTNLQDHLNCGISVEVQDDIETSDVLRRDPDLRASMAKEYLDQHTGPFSEGSAYSFAYMPLQVLLQTSLYGDLRQRLEHKGTGDASSQAQQDFVIKMMQDPSEATAALCMLRLQRHPDARSTAERNKRLVDGNYLTVVAMLSHPLSRGSVHIQSKDPTTKPKISFNYLSNPSDKAILAAHMLQIEQLLKQEPLKNCIKPNGRRLPLPQPHEVTSLEEAEGMLSSCSATNDHPCGTCAMMRRDMGGVVDESMKVYGTTNVRVCDASVLPIIPRANILTTVYAVADKGVDIIRDELVDFNY